MYHLPNNHDYREQKNSTFEKLIVCPKLAYIKLNVVKPYNIPNERLFLMLKDGLVGFDKNVVTGR